MKKKTELIWFENSEGNRIGFKPNTKIAELVKLGARVELVPRGAKPTKTIYIGPA